MWSLDSRSYRSALTAPRRKFYASEPGYLKWPLLFFFIAAIASQGLFAQGNSEEFVALKRYTLPSTAIPIQDLVEKDANFSLKGQPFTGIAFERYENGQLLRVVHLHQGLQNGPLYLWYPNGNPQMSANYRMGRLRGRFLGWYANGGTIYDMMIGTNGYNGDILEDDSQRGDDDIDDTEMEGTDND